MQVILIILNQKRLSFERFGLNANIL